MRKKGRKRKHEGSNSQPSKQYAQTDLPDEKPVDCKEHGKAAADAQGERKGEEEHPMGLRELANRSSLTDWLIAIFTLVLAGSAIYQFIIMNGQLGVMQVDQRAWLKMAAAPNRPGGESFTLAVTPGQPVSFPLVLTNTGKTPALDVAAKMFIAIVDASQSPPLEQVQSNKYPHGLLTMGILFPNVDVAHPVTRTTEKGQPIAATDSEVLSLKEGKSYVAAYGVVTYRDVFKVPHWTKFCSWIAEPKSTFAAAKCVAFNTVDGK
jgi:hypothetical protein